ncbi:MAG: hypothetical protein ABSE81_06240 [Candidatus Omnitrophota bacterium]|jgi:hypothetical protein
MDILYTCKFSFYGFGIEVNCQDRETLQNIQRDYSFFLSDSVAAKVFFEISNEAPDYSQFPPVKAHSYTNHNIRYRYKDLTFIDYFSRGLAVIDRRKNIYKVFCPEPHLRHEIVYLYILALVGQNLGLRGLHRVHGLGLEVNNKAILILLPSGGGKTTLLLDLIKNGAVKLVSEDSPLLDATGQMLPFPIRIGVLAEDRPQDIPDEHLHLVERMGFRPKYMIDIDVFKDKIAQKPLGVQYIFCGVRCLGNRSFIKPISKYSAFKQFVENCVFGIGLYEGAEFLIQRGFWGFLKKSPVLFSRLKNTVKAVSQSRTYSFAISYDLKKNAETFLNFCRENTN